MGAPQTWWQKALVPHNLVFNSFFHGFHVLLFAYGWYKQANSIPLASLNVLSYSLWFSRGAGLALSVDVLLLPLPMCRNLLRWIRPKVRWLRLDESQWFHRQVAYSMLAWTVVHVCGHYVNFFNISKHDMRPQTPVEMHYTEVAGITGHIMLLCMLLIYTSAHAKIRQQSFETFWYTHHLFIPFFISIYSHAAGCFVRDTPQPYSPFDHNFCTHCLGYQAWRWELLGGSIYMFERIYREIRAARETHITKVVRHPSDAMEIQFRKPSMKYKAGQWLFLNVSTVSGFQWHPFTITSCPHDPYISVHVRQVGDFTRALGGALGVSGMAEKETDASEPVEIALKNGQEMPKLRIDGPYGAPAEDVFENDFAILIGTGIGVTPWASILKDIWHTRSSPNPPRRLRRVEFIWVCKDTGSFEWFQNMLASLEAQCEGSDFLRIHTYLTQRLDQDAMQNIVLNSVGTAVDPLTELKARTNFGRPNFASLFGGIRDGILDQTYIKPPPETVKSTVGVYFCGPNVAAKDIKKACRKVTCEEVKFSFWKEHF